MEGYKCSYAQPLGLQYTSLVSLSLHQLPVSENVQFDHILH